MRIQLQEGCGGSEAIHTLFLQMNESEKDCAQLVASAPDAYTLDESVIACGGCDASGRCQVEASYPTVKVLDLLETLSRNELLS